MTTTPNLAEIGAQLVKLIGMLKSAGLLDQSMVEIKPDGAGASTPFAEAVTRWRDVLAGEDKSRRTIESYAHKVNQCGKVAGWRTVGDVSHESALAFIASRRRNDHDGRAWENGAIRHCISSLRSFGKFLQTSGLCGTDPLASLNLPKRRPQRHKHPFTESEARALIAAALVRHRRDRRARGHAPLVWATLFLTGLRHSEVQAPSGDNPYGGLKWRDVQLDAEYPGITTDPKWVGNKASTRDWIPLHPRLLSLLRAHQTAVPHGPDDPVFPVWPIRATWMQDRKAAKLPAHDADGRALSVHATRASFCTWVGKLTLPEGLRDRLSRHQLGIAEGIYNTRHRSEFAAAIAQLPDIWPEGTDSISSHTGARA
jgi:integrase